MDMAASVIVILWLASGAPAFNFMPAEQCRALKAMTEASGGVEIELSDGQILKGTRVECVEHAGSEGVPTQ